MKCDDTPIAPRPPRTSARGARPYVLVYFGNPVGVLDDPLWLELAKTFGSNEPLKLLPAFRLAPERMQRVIDRATQAAKERGLRDYRPLAFRNYFLVPLPPAAKRPVFDLYCGLKKLAETRRGYAYLSMPTRTSSGSDAYLGPGGQPSNSASGIGATGLAGGNGGPITGNGERLVCLEKGWLYPNLDKRAPRIPNLAGAIVDSLQDPDLEHGGAVLSILAGGAGVTDLAGIAPSARIERAPFLDANGIDFAADAIYAATDALHAGGGAGGVILIQHETWDGSPSETDPFTLKAMEDAYLNGQIVVEPAGNKPRDADGNAGVDLATVAGYKLDPADPDGAPVERMLDGTERSPAILVAAGLSGTGTNKPCGARRAESNYGAIIDAWAWGDSIRALGLNIDPATGDRVSVEHPIGFDGTSGAASIVAGAVVLMQALRTDAGKPRLTPDQVRTLLADYGTPGSGELVNKRMPDLGAMRDDLRQRD